jgi:hypothetical protein
MFPFWRLNANPCSITFKKPPEAPYLTNTGYWWIYINLLFAEGMGKALF